MKTYIVETGKDHFKKTIEIKLPPVKQLGVLMSGGADSAILLYLLAKLNLENGSPCTITTFTVPKTDGSKAYSEIVVGYINSLLETDINMPHIVGDISLHHSQQVVSGRNEAMEKYGIETIAYGSQQVPPEEEIKIDWEYPFRPNQIDYPNIYCPFALVDKRNTIDLFRIFDRMDLLSLTHSCTEKTIGRCGKCFNCIERQWSLDSNQLVDSGEL